MMSHPKSMAAHCKGRHLKAAGFTSLAISAMAGAVMLSGGEAKAICTASGLDGNMIPGPATCAIADPNLGVQTTQASIIIGSSLPAGTNVNYELTNLFYPLSQTEIDTDFNDPYTGGPITSVYKVTALNGTLIDGIDLGANGIGGFTVTKEVFSSYDPTTQTLSGPITTPLSLTGAGFVPVQPFSPISEIYIRDTFNNPVSGQSNIDNVTNTVRTPGPLPILGAGAAFGFSRKLRGRIKAARLG
jgi:hypothetical protein